MAALSNAELAAIVARDLPGYELVPRVEAAAPAVETMASRPRLTLEELRAKFLGPNDVVNTGSAADEETPEDAGSGMVTVRPRAAGPSGRPLAAVISNGRVTGIQG